MGKKEVDPRIDLIIDTVSKEHEPIPISTVAKKLDIEEQLVKNIVASYIKQQTSVKNLMFHRIEPRFFVLAHGLKEFVDDKNIQKWVQHFYKMTGC
jgi:hypothetical protein